jgi:hypothetical protein
MKENRATPGSTTSPAAPVTRTEMIVRRRRMGRRSRPPRRGPRRSRTWHPPPGRGSPPASPGAGFPAPREPAARSHRASERRPGRQGESKSSSPLAIVRSEGTSRVRRRTVEVARRALQSTDRGRGGPPVAIRGGFHTGRSPCSMVRTWTDPDGASSSREEGRFR